CAAPWTTWRGRCWCLPSEAGVTERSQLVKGATMTATVGAGSQEALAAPPVVPPTPAQPSSKDPEHERQLLQALGPTAFTPPTPPPPSPPPRPPSPTATAARRCT